jgi:LysM repeat protein
MKRVLILVLLPLALLRFPARAQDTSVTPTPTTTAAPSTAAAIAAREEAEDRYKRMAADFQALQADNQLLHSKVASLEQDLQTLRDAQAKGPDVSGVQEELKKLAQAIQEVDKKRLEDKDAISEQIRKSVARLESALGNSPPPPVHAPGPDTKPPPASTLDPSAIENGYVYVIQPGNTLGEILKAYNKDFKSKGLKTISVREAMAANPKVDWGRLRVGQKIIIPRPPGG